MKSKWLLYPISIKKNPGLLQEETPVSSALMRGIVTGLTAYTLMLKFPAQDERTKTLLISS